MEERSPAKIKGAIGLSIFLFVFCVLSLIASLLIHDVRRSTYTNFLPILLSIVLLVLIKQKHYSAVYFVGLGAAVFQMGIMEVLDLAGVGFQMSLMVMIVGIAMAMLMLPIRKITNGMILSVVFGNAISLFDYFGPSSRPPVSTSTERIMIYFSIFMTVAVLYFIFRLWHEFDFSTKMVISMLISVTISVALIHIYLIFSNQGYIQLLAGAGQETGKIQSLVVKRNEFLVILGNAGGLLSAVLGYFLAKLTTRPLHHMMKDVDHIVATGNTTGTITIESSDEIGELAGSLQKLTDYIKDKAETAGRLSHGDLTETVQTLSDEDTLGMAFKQMHGNLNKTMALVVENTRTLRSVSEQLEQISSISDTAADQIARTIQQVAQGITQETESTGITSKMVEQMVHAIEGVAQGASEQTVAVAQTTEAAARIDQNVQQVIDGISLVSDQSSATQRAAIEGQQEMQTSLQGMIAIRDQVTLSADKVEEMGRYSQNIGIILETISEIASQTNLLALNAAIEAARAGESGKGFAVVADEVRKLAERSGSATKEISELVKNIQRTVADAIIAMRDTTSDVDRGVSNSKLTNSALEKIIDSIKTVDDQAKKVTDAALEMRNATNILVNSVDSVSSVVEENTAATEEMSASSNTVSQAIESISSVSEENSAAVEEVSASAEEMSAQAKGVTELAHTAARIANDLNDAVMIFKLADNN